MPDHGSHFDNFRSQSYSGHGPQYDEGFPLSGAYAAEAHGKLFDQFAKRPGLDRHGEHFDDFGWTPIPRHHGNAFDSDFNKPAALDNGTGHGTWHDVFRGARVRYMSDGSDYEGTVTNTHDDYMEVTSTEGERHEVVIPQVLAFATAQGNPHVSQVKAAEPGATDAGIVGGPQGERPSGRSVTASGHGPRTAVDPDIATSSPTLNKAFTQLSEIAKAMDSSETAVQAKDEDDGGKTTDVSKGANWCSHCKHYCRDVEDGKCPTCGHSVGVKKSWDDALDVLKEPQRRPLCAHCGKRIHDGAQTFHPSMWKGISEPKKVHADCATAYKNKMGLTGKGT